MTIIGTATFRLTAKNQQLYKGSLIYTCTEKLKQVKYVDNCSSTSIKYQSDLDADR